MGQLQGALKLPEELLLLCLAAVDLETEVPHADLVQPALHDLESRHLLAYEEHASPGSKQLAYQIRDGLRLASSRRPLDDKIAPGLCLLNNSDLRRVGIHDVENIARVSLRSTSASSNVDSG